MTPLMTKTRLSKLQGVQTLMEIHQFVAFMNQVTIATTEGCAKSKKLLEKWSTCLPDPKRDTISVWDDVVTNRSALLCIACNVMQSNIPTQCITFSKFLSKCNLFYRLKSIQALVFSVCMIYPSILDLHPWY